MRYKTSVIALATALSSLALGASASAATFSGVVVHENARAHSFVVALRGGSLRAVHARRAPALGRHVTVTARRLRNGTWALQRIRVGRGSRTVRVHGIVTYVNARRHEFVVSARGVSMLIHTRVAGRLAADGQVSDGEIVTVDGSVDGGTVDATNVQAGGQDTNGIDLEGTVQAIDPTARTLSITADDENQSGSTLTVDVPASFDLTLFSVGQSVELIVSPNPDGTYTLEQSSNDTGAQNANNQGEDQGNGHGDQQSSADQVCTAQQSDPNFSATHNGESFVQFWQTDPNNPNDAFGNCVDAMAHGTATNPSPELVCHQQASDPNFSATHSGQTFAQFYNPQDPTNLNDAYGHCIDTNSQQQDGQGSGSTDSGSSGSGGSDTGGSTSAGSGSGSGSGDTSGSTSGGSGTDG